MLQRFFLISFVCTGVFSGKLYSQDFKKAVSDIQQTYAKLEKLYATITIKGFESETSASPFYQERAVVKKDHENYHYSLGKNDMLLNEKYLISLLNDSRQIMIASRQPNQLGVDPVRQNIDSMLNIHGMPEYKGRTDDLDHYSMSYSIGGIRQIDMHINTTGSFLQKIEYRYAAGQFVSVTFDVFDTAPEFTPEAFSESVYIQVTDGKIKPAAAFAGYQIINANPENQIFK